MTDDFLRYESMRNAGTGPEAVYLEAVKNGVDSITCIRLIRAVYSLSPRQAKEVMVRAEGCASTLNEYQGKLADDLLKEAAVTTGK